MRELTTLVLACALSSGCSHRVALYCDAETPCIDPDRPFCDVAGEFPASEGIRNTCIPDPTPDAGPGGDNADADVPRLPVTQITAGQLHTCALLDTGAVRCWGNNANGQLGYGHINNIGDNEHPYEAGDVPIGGRVRQVAAGTEHTCALLESGAIRCWGNGADGRLGYASIEDIGDDETVEAFNTDVSVGGTALQVVGGHNFTCALLEGGSVRCWGSRGAGVLGPGAPVAVGDDETPASRDPIDIGGPAVALAAGREHVCALVSGGGVRCWGDNIVGSCGYPTNEDVGDNEQPASMGLVDVGGDTAALSVGGGHTCALLTNGAVRCWGANGTGTLGYGNFEHIGDNEVPATAGNVSIGHTVEAIAAIGSVNCVILSNQSVRCWGAEELTGLGPDSPPVLTLPIDYPIVPLDRPVVKLSEHGGNAAHMCAIVDSGGVRCWGINGLQGALGYANTEDIGDNEPVQNVDVQILDP